MSDWKEEDGRGYYAPIGFVVGYGAGAKIQYTAGWHRKGGGMGFRFVGYVASSILMMEFGMGT